MNNINWEDIKLRFSTEFNIKSYSGVYTLLVAHEELFNWLMKQPEFNNPKIMKEPLSIEEKIWIATVAVAKKMDYEELKYSDYLYGHENEIESVWEFVNECEDIGRIAFYEKYKNIKKYGDS